MSAALAGFPTLRRECLAVVLPLAATLHLVGCARDSVRAFDARLDALVGQPTTALVARLGMPDRVTQLPGEPPGRAQLDYRLIWPVLVGNQQAMPAGTEAPSARTCDIAFLSEAGRVVRHIHVGEVCGWGGLPDIGP